MSIINDNLEATILALKAAFPRDKQEWWSSILETLNYVGVADTNHLKTDLGMTQNILKRRLEILLVTNYKGLPLISEIPHSIKRSGQAHRPAAIYRIEEGGAALLRALGIENARACALSEDIQIVHALCMLTFYLLALREKDLTILTDRNVNFGEDRHFRPDHQVIHLNGDCFIFEIEQIVKTKHLPRIMESIANRQDFFKSKEAQAYSKAIRMILNIKDGKPYHNTLRVWAEAMRQQEIKSGQELGFTIYAIPIQKFLDAPEWGSELSTNWTLIVLNETSTEREPLYTPSTARPRRSMEQSAVLLQAFEQRQRKNHTYTKSLEVDMGFVSLIEEIYAGSFGEEHRDFDSIAAVPRVSMDKLREYLVEMEPDLRKILDNTMNNYRNPKVGTQLNIMHQMGRVIREFLKYHNWTVGEYLHAYPTIDSELRNSYIVKVEFLAFPDSIEYRDRRQNMEAALTWVLWALFEYADDVGLKTPGFWK